jgi:hypothetical protein
LSEPQRVRVKKAHRLRGVVSEKQVRPPLYDVRDLSGVWVDLDSGTSTLYLACELEAEDKPCDCLWCKP